MRFTITLFRGILPAALLLTSLALSSCGKDCDPRPKHKKECDKDKDNSTTTSTTKPGGAS
ncbi:hypothetical protein [Hymenobacter properus]|uniref:Lipoprotein n=1 Tax=Hymenobacter properus TaxID=2791026 RepID=A0A931FK77_9BACT|nr:hypothetical protein [Hymenobacter properus]MBF9140716.1 hypothetical protein [Hymenobacter properus]MBR7719524.1 hypothetical protein [Microvirga sp. SRT04]